MTVQQGERQVIKSQVRVRFTDVASFNTNTWSVKGGGGEAGWRGAKLRVGKKLQGTIEKPGMNYCKVQDYQITGSRYT